MQRKGIAKIKKSENAERLKEISDAVRKETDPIHTKLDEMQKQLTCNDAGTVVLLRDRMQCSLNYCLKQGYKTIDDVNTWMQMYDTYKALGGNNFHSTIDVWKDELEKLPLKDRN